MNPARGPVARPPVNERRPTAVATRVSLGLLGVALLALGVWLVLAWVDSAAGYDSTCENALRYWTDGPRQRSCRAQMSLRVVAAVAFASLGGGYLASSVLAEKPKRLAGLQSPPVVAVVLLVATATAIWNEITRSGGLWEN